MEILADMSLVGIYATFAATLIAAFLAVTVRNIFHAALNLVFALLGIAGVYFILHAEFLGAIQILLYVGAIMTLVIFVVMLTSRIGDRSISTSNRQRYPVLLGVLLLLLFLIQLFSKIRWPLKTSLTTIDAVQIGKILMGPYVLPFEIVSVLLVVALIGAVIIARSEKEK